ncbi:sodium channel protein Nach-like [Condylostylus longicornis]|uniref:sodium channel protein Nach-like n=1 Tax=Condylostylus longicornis TaxID=2530218 RepID=UPI00244E2468|nr:sodium channel protein Nach-like [Condylostylus longicornis]
MESETVASKPQLDTKPKTDLETIVDNTLKPWETQLDPIKSIETTDPKLNKKPDKTKRHIFFEAFKKTFIDFTQTTSIQGLKYITDPEASNFWRGVWVVIVFVSFCCANQLVSTFYGDFINNPTRVNIDTVHAKLPNLEFPAVTICNADVISYLVAKDLVNALKLPKNVTNMTALNTVYQAAGMDLKANYDENMLVDLQEIMEANRYTIPVFMSSLRQKCEDFFVKCRWRLEIIPCHKLFTQARTFFGECCSFNIKQDGIPYKNIFSLEAGIFGGLSVMLSPIMDDKAVTEFESRGFRLIIHKNDVFPTHFDDPLFIGLGLESFIGIQAQEIICSNQVKQLSVSDRGCVFRNERPLAFFPEYDSSNCQVECMINNVIQNCGCSPYFFGIAGTNQICNFSKVPCLVENYDLNFAEEGTSFYKCSCLPNCVDITYKTTISQVPLEKMPECVEPFYSDMKDKTNNTVIHIYMDSQTYTRFRRDLIYNIINLISNFGGSYSLFLGISTVSAIEFIYFFTFVLRRNYLEHLECHNKVTAFLRVVEKPNLKKVKYDEDISVIKINTISGNQFDIDKVNMEVLNIEDLIEKELSFAKNPDYDKKENKNRSANSTNEDKTIQNENGNIKFQM